MIPPLQIDNLEPIFDLNEAFFPPPPIFEFSLPPCLPFSLQEGISSPKTLQIELLQHYLLDLQKNPEHLENLLEELYQAGMPLQVLNFWTAFNKSENAGLLLDQFSKTFAFTSEFVQMSALLGSSYVKHLLDFCPEPLEEKIKEPLHFFPHLLLDNMEIDESNKLIFLIFIQQPGILERVTKNLGDKFFDFILVHPNFSLNLLKNLEEIGLNRASIFTALRSWAKSRPPFYPHCQTGLSKILDPEIANIGFWVLSKYQQNIFLENRRSLSDEGLELILFSTKKGLHQLQEALPVLLEYSSRVGNELILKATTLFKKNLADLLPCIHPVEHNRLLRQVLLPKKNVFSLRLIGLIQSGNFLWSNIASPFFNILLSELSKEDQFFILTQQDFEGNFLFSNNLNWLNLKASPKTQLLKEISMMQQPVLENILRIAQSEILNKMEKLKIFEEMRLKTFIRHLDSPSQEEIFAFIEGNSPTEPLKKKKR